MKSKKISNVKYAFFTICFVFFNIFWFFGDFQFSLNTNFKSEKAFKHPNIPDQALEKRLNLENSIEIDEEVNVFIILCVVKDSKNFGEEEDRQPGQLTTLLKTLYLFSSVPVNVHILNNDEKSYKSLMRELDTWEINIKTKLTFHNVKITYPEGLTNMIKMFRMCATARLFIDHMLPDIDAGIFLDTDILLMDNIKILWNYFKKFSPVQVAGMSPTENIYNTVEDLPYYGPPGVGLNAGVIMMNLTRMRHMPGGGFTGSVRWVYNKYKDNLLLADQDILNALFGISPWYLFELPCTWNYVIWQCRVDFWSEKPNPRTWLGKNQCKEAEETGVSLIHGNSSSFYVSFEEIFREIYNYFANTKLEEINVNHLSSKLREIIESVRKKTEKNVKKEDDLSPCSKVNNIGDIFVKRLPAQN